MRSTDNECKLPMERLFAEDGMYKVLDCFMSNYELEQTVSNMSDFTKLKKSKVNKCLEILVRERLLIKGASTFKTNLRSDRLIGLFSYYRATMSENLKNLEFKTIRNHC